jgi:site-specific DNA recombinase
MIAALEKHRDVPRHLLTKRNIERFAAAARTRLRDENARLRKGYMRQLVSRIEVGDRQIRVSGPESILAEGVLDSGSDPAAGVPSFVQGWWVQ